jgi:hypothetical protein
MSDFAVFSLPASLGFLTTPALTAILFLLFVPAMVAYKRKHANEAIILAADTALSFAAYVPWLTLLGWVAVLIRAVAGQTEDAVLQGGFLSICDSTTLKVSIPWRASPPGRTLSSAPATADVPPLTGRQHQQPESQTFPPALEEGLTRHGQGHPQAAPGSQRILAGQYPAQAPVSFQKPGARPPPALPCPAGLSRETGMTAPWAVRGRIDPRPVRACGRHARHPAAPSPAAGPGGGAAGGTPPSGPDPAAARPPSAPAGPGAGWFRPAAAPVRPVGRGAARPGARPGQGRREGTVATFRTIFLIKIVLKIYKN